MTDKHFDLTGVGIYAGAIITQNLSQILSLLLLGANLFYITYQLKILHEKRKKEEEEENNN
tara:strand:- start:240 stop:422 length:183 start_codon:yes stop_codon:yes gene_type:complete